MDWYRKGVFQNIYYQGQGLVNKVFFQDHSFQTG